MSTSSIVDALRALADDPRDASRVVVSGASGFLVVEAAAADDRVLVLAAGSAHVKLRPDQVQTLRARGFTRLAGRPSLGRIVVRPEPEALAARLAETLREVYGDEQLTAVLRPGDRPSLDDARLLAAMRTLAKERDMPSRNRVYGAVLGADLLVPVHADGPAVVGDLEGWQVVAAFTGFDQLLAWDPRSPAVRRMPGIELFPMLAALPRIGSILINPRGTVGGELYRNEILALARATQGKR